MTRVVFTCGDINGIGPEIALKAFSDIFQKRNNNQIFFVCPENVFDFYYKLTKASFKYQLAGKQSFSNSFLNLIPLPYSKINFGKPTSLSGRIAFKSINKSLELINSDKADVLVTTPISKKAFNLAKINFPGHTELLAKSENNKNYMMLFLSEKIKAGLLTIHTPISKVSNLIIKERIIKSIGLLNFTAKQDLGISNPKIAVLGLNPHAGENGLIGNEEERILKPAIKSLQKKINVTGPFVPDAFWGNKTYKKFDMILGMYHDQILIPFKLLNFNSGVNFTAGLNLIRTSPDHGTAYDIAGLNKANESSLLQAFKYAIKIFHNRKHFVA
ncbi:MAG: 4-hydroxythreonine-4-phosphate dehydrogenase PdxA, partial [Ignavibacteria bacterium]|nr:4-hydroxythreonine-4-phosphate dehydrogenase PdxA [Ignavibacteria bacterium]